MAVAAAVMLLLGGVIAAVEMTAGNQSSPPEAQRRHVTHRPSTGAGRGTQPTRQRTSHGAAVHAAAPPSHRSASSAPARTAPTAARLAAAIVNYYRLLPGDTSAAWPLLTPSYQQNTAGSRANYDGFWNDFRSVSATDVVATPPHRVVATITYTRTDGTVSQERTGFEFVWQDGELKINSSYVISSF